MAYLKLFRVVNLLIIALIMYLLRFFLFEPAFALDNIVNPFTELQFAMLVLTYVFITAGGYAINDYYDIGMDEINRPGKTILRNKLPLRAGMNLFFVMTAIGIAIGLVLAYQMGSFSMYFFPIFVAAMYWFYSTKYKRELMSGNLVVSFLAALSILLVFLYFVLSFTKTNQFPVLSFPYIKRAVLIYAGFAFYITFLREMIKDIIDVEGDKEFKCTNIAIKYGQKETNLIVQILSYFFLAALLVFAYFSWQMGKTYLTYYIAVILIPFFVYFIIQLRKAKGKGDYRSLATLLKIYMVAGILSIQLLDLSNQWG
ncbi:MAG: geranylgeranylglycerol-phosphate geranylgeranyltransferase [Bacteroidales bacterium]|nr:geranylgeranylglycerol-phosphate geranylgeranyltransferase [Bacteroidales bacterium]